MENNLHTFLIESRKRVTATMIEEVLSFSDREIRLKCKDGSSILIVGQTLKILCFDNKVGSFTMSGDIESVRYKSQHENFIKKALK